MERSARSLRVPRRDDVELHFFVEAELERVRGNFNGLGDSGSRRSPVSHAAAMIKQAGVPEPVSIHPDLDANRHQDSCVVQPHSNRWCRSRI